MCRCHATCCAAPMSGSTDTDTDCTQPQHPRLMATLWTAPSLLVSAFFVWAIVDLSMGHLDDSSGLLMIPIAVALAAVGVLIAVYLAPSDDEARQRSTPLLVLGMVSLLIMTYLASQFLQL